MNLKGMLATKPIAAYQREASHEGLKRALGIPSLIAFGIGGIIGTGIFVLTGVAAATHAGPAIVISFIIAGMILVPTVEAVASLASKMMATVLISKVFLK